MSNIRFADQFPGNDQGHQITAAIADLPASGGTVDARGFEGTKLISTNVFAGLNKPLTLLLERLSSAVRRPKRLQRRPTFELSELVAVEI
jgi:hypothetical protein